MVDELEWVLLFECFCCDVRLIGGLLHVHRSTIVAGLVELIEIVDLFFGALAPHYDVQVLLILLLVLLRVQALLALNRSRQLGRW